MAGCRSLRTTRLALGARSTASSGGRTAMMSPDPAGSTSLLRKGNTSTKASEWGKARHLDLPRGEQPPYDRRVPGLHHGRSVDVPLKSLAAASSGAKGSRWANWGG